jgi:phytoene synthase
MYGIYAFCRLVDDIADGDAPLHEKRLALDDWRTRIDDLTSGHAENAMPRGAEDAGPPGAEGAVPRVLLLSCRIFALRRIDFRAVIDGMQMDAETEIVAPALQTLDLYCDRVASAVGRLSVRAFGDSSPAADEVAHHLGRALQITNILRDLGEDAARGRLYLPREWLAEASVPAIPKAALQDPNLREVCERAARRAHAHFFEAEAAMARCDPKAMKPARLMAASYAAILRRLEQRGWSRPEQRVAVPKWEKLWIAMRYAVG